MAKSPGCVMSDVCVCAHSGFALRQSVSSGGGVEGVELCLPQVTHTGGYVTLNPANPVKPCLLLRLISLATPLQLLPITEAFFQQHA